MPRLRELMTTWSRCRYLLWRATKSTIPVKVQLKSGEYLSLRQEPTTDLAIAYEIFVDKTYTCPHLLEPSSVHCIVDVGANVGFSLIFWLYQYPEAQILAYEPDPVHLEQIQRHLKFNQADKRVSLRPVAAGTEIGEMYLTNEGAKSKLCSHALENTIQVTIVDWFNELKNCKIDLLKIDIEGGEYPLLSDPRFEQIKARTIVLEWHENNELSNAADWCINKLRSLGYDVLVQDSYQTTDAGLLWGFYKN